MNDNTTEDPQVKTPIIFSGDAEDNTLLLSKYEINCDMGEGFGPWKMGPDDEIMPLIDSANIACGGHAGDPKTMESTVRMAKQYNVKCGAHVGLPDKEGFGRRRWAIEAEDVYRLVVFQTGALMGFLNAEGMQLTHIKPHGELYFYVERDEEVMNAVIRAAKVFNVPLVASKSCKYYNVVHEFNSKLIQEFYPDLNYSPEGKLCKIKAGPKSNKSAETIKLEILRACLADQVLDIDNQTLNLKFSGAPVTVCLHSDIPGALDNVKAARVAIDEINKTKGFA